jgi:hypothetical protein
MEEKLNLSKLKNFPWTVFSIAIFIWVAIAGLNFYYRSQGDLTRAGILLIPYFLILLKDINVNRFRILFHLYILQTFGMQMIGDFYY